MSHAADSQYLAYLDQLSQPKGEAKKGEIEIVTASEEMKVIEQKQKARLIKAGFSESDAELYSKAGIAYEDQYWIIFRDAVSFPSGSQGTYLRLLWKTAIPSGSAGVAILPILPDGKISVNLNYRHATRSWEIELPRGLRKAGESDEDTAKREFKEETGLETAIAKSLGTMAADTGALGCVTPIYLVKASKQGISDQEYSEAIAEVLAFSVKDLEQALIQGYAEVTLNGEKTKVPVRDSHLAFALLQAKLQHEL